MVPLYTKPIIDHARHPRYTAPVSQPTHQAETVNRSCGDEVAVTMRVQGDRITDVGVVTEGCALTIAGGSLLAEHLIGQSLAEVWTIDESTILHLAGDSTPSPSRRQCLLLGYRTLRQALSAESV